MNTGSAAPSGRPMTPLILVFALSQSPLYRWEDPGGSVHFSADHSEVPKGVKAEVIEVGPPEKNGLMPAPEPVRGPYSRPEWRAKFTELRERRLRLSAASGLTSRQCRDRTVEVTVEGRGPTQTQVFIRDCPPNLACDRGHWATVQVPAEPARKTTAVVQDCVDTLVVSAQAALTEGFVALRADEEALTAFANRHGVPQAWREP